MVLLGFSRCVGLKVVFMCKKVLCFLVENCMYIELSFFMFMLCLFVMVLFSFM